MTFAVQGVGRSRAYYWASAFSRAAWNSCSCKCTIFMSENIDAAIACAACMAVESYGALDLAGGEAAGLGAVVPVACSS